MENIQLLVSRYLDDELSNDEIDRLAGALRDGGEALDCFVLGSFIHSHLNEWMDQQRVQDNAMHGVAPAAREVRTGSAESAIRLQSLLCDCPELEDVDFAPRRLWWPRALAARAALLFVAASITLATYLYLTRPVIVGQITQATGCQWEADHAAMPVGTLLESGQDLRMLKGRALITLVTGTQVLLEGPTALRLNSASEVDLQRGRIAAKVPTPAIGFTVQSSLARFVDLGTAFTLSLRESESFELYVFEGLVELQLDERFGDAAHQPLRVAEVRAVRFDVDSGNIEALPFNNGEQMPF